MNPRRSSRANSKITAVSSATIPARATYCVPAGVAMPDTPPAKIAAVAESAATTRYRDEPKAANAASGSMSE